MKWSLIECLAAVANLLSVTISSAAATFDALLEKKAQESSAWQGFSPWPAILILSVIAGGLLLYRMLRRTSGGPSAKDDPHSTQVEGQTTRETGKLMPTVATPITPAPPAEAARNRPPGMER